MCGIAGIVPADRDRPVDLPTLCRMGEAIAHRGPDDTGQNVFAGSGLVSRRLAILDLSARGHMPMQSADGRYWIAHNGEVYNFRQLRSDLEQQGHRFVSDSDTEVILALYATEGPAALAKMNGMFAFAIWDSQERVLFAARDRLGVKPFYFAWHDRQLVFASEAKALWSAGVPREFDHSQWEELLCFRYVAGAETAFRGIRRLLPGHYLTLKDGVLRERRWWTLADRVASSDTNGVLRDRFVGTFDDSIALRRISDVPVGVFLSGGLDSASVAAATARQAGPGVAAFTVRFPEARFDEGPSAASVAAKWKLRRHELTIAGGELPALLRKVAWLNDEPLVHGTEAHLYALSAMAKPLVTVLLSGEGADETLGGYVRYRPLLHPRALGVGGYVLPVMARLRGSNRRFAKLARFAGLRDLDRAIVYNACDVLPADLPSIGLEPSWRSPYREAMLHEAKRYHTEPVRQLMYLDQHTFLRSVLDLNDRTTMGASIECRVPFLDYRLVELAAAMPTEHLLGASEGKRPIRRWLGDRLPAGILTKRKWGFGVPWPQYFRDVPELRDGLRQLGDSRFLESAPIDRRALDALVRRFETGDAEVFPLLFRVYLTELCWTAGAAG